MNPAVYYLSGLEAYPDYVPTEVVIGGQIWDQKNLNTARYRDGSAIPTSGTFFGATTGKWRYYDNSQINGGIYGRLYNWYAAVGVYDAASLSTPALRKNIAPVGWRVATDADWDQLAGYVTTLSPAGNVGGKLKETGISHWTSPNISATNLTNFTGLPGGAKSGVDGAFTGINTLGTWFTYNETTTTGRNLAYNSGTLSSLTPGSTNASSGRSIRLIKEDIIITGFTTTAVTNVAAQSVTSGGEFTILPVTVNGVVKDISDKGICWGTGGFPNIVTDSSIPAGPGTTPNPYSINITGLTPSVTYNIRAYATLSDGSGTAYSNIVSFTTTNGYPTVTTDDISNITSSTATGGGNVTSDGGFTVTERGVCWNTSSGPTIANFKTIDSSGTGSFTSSITGLASSETYYVRAYAKNSITTTYGDEKVFMTAVGVGLILDLYPSAHHAYSLRKLRTLYTGYCLRVRRTVGATTVIVDVPFDTTTNEVALTSLISLPPVSGTTTATTLGQFAAIAGYGTADPGVPANQNIFVQIWYDQSGNGKNLIQNTTGNQPVIVSGGSLSGTGVAGPGRAAVRFTRTSGSNFSISDNTANINNMSSFWAGEFVGTTGAQIGYLLSAANRFYLPYSSGSNVYAGYGASATAITLETGVPVGNLPGGRRLYELISPAPGSSTVAQAWTNGTAKAAIPLLNSAITNIQVGTGATNYLDGWVHEVIGWQSNAGRLGKEININTYWGIF